MNIKPYKQNKNMEKRYNVYIVSIHDGKAESIIGKNLNERQAEKRVMSGLMRINTERYFVGDYEVGSEGDIKHSKQLEE